MRAILLILLVATLAVPATTATHAFAYYELGDRSAGITREPDDAIVSASGNTLHGLVNKVTRSGDTPGDGTLFLDARASSFVGVRDINTGSEIIVGTDSPLDSAFDLALGRPDLLLPVQRHISAWYGWWNDINDDGVIDDVHDAALDGTDEFLWRGQASNEQVPVVAYVLPRTSQAMQNSVSALGTNEGNVRGSNVADLKDFTRAENPEQGWTGAFFRSHDGGLLMRWQTVVIADALPTTSDPLYSLVDADALYDVDVYEAVSPEVEFLYLASVRGADAAASDASGPVDDARDTAIGIYAPIIASALALTDPMNAYGTAVGAYQSSTPKEPNTVWDDYEGRATFGGTGDHRGSGNAYPGYGVNDPHFYYDQTARTAGCVRGYAAIADAETTVSVFCPLGYYGAPGPLPNTGAGSGPIAHADPVGAQTRDGTQGAGTITTWQAFAILWQDANGDAHVGKVCDADDPDAFDVEGNTCRETPPTWPGYSNSETRDVCTDARAAGTSLIVRPENGVWPPGTVLMKDYAEPTRQAFALSWSLITGTDPVEIRWADQCAGSGATTPRLAARDAIFFAEGAAVTLRVQGEAHLERYENTQAGILIGPEYVRDVDILPASL